MFLQVSPVKILSNINSYNLTMETIFLSLQSGNDAGIMLFKQNEEQTEKKQVT